MLMNTVEKMPSSVSAKYYNFTQIQKMTMQNL